MSLNDIFFTIFAALVIGALFAKSNYIKQQNKIVSKLIALGGSIAHELRTPLAALRISGSSSARQANRLLKTYYVAKEHNLNVDNLSDREIANIKADPKRIDEITQEALTIIDMLLVKLKDPSQEAEVTVCSVKQSVEEAVDRYPMPSEDRELVKLHLEDDFEFQGNKTMFSHVIFNLTKNALHYIKQAGKGEIIITAEKGSKVNRLYFRDTGKGIPQEMVGHMFERFYSKTQHGTGLGLAFCKLVMEDIGGTISCQSVYGEYIEFTLEFPKT